MTSIHAVNKAYGLHLRFACFFMFSWFRKEWGSISGLKCSFADPFDAGGLPDCSMIQNGLIGFGITKISESAKNNRFSEQSQLAIWIDLLHLHTLFVYVVKENWINLRFFVVFGRLFDQFSSFFLSDHVSTTFLDRNAINYWSNVQNTCINLRCLHWKHSW